MIISEIIISWSLNLLIISIYCKYLTSKSTYPINFDGMTSTAHEMEIIKSSDILSELKKNYGEPSYKHSYHFDDNKVLMIENVISKTVQDKIENNINFSFILDEEISGFHFDGKNNNHNEINSKHLCQAIKIHINSKVEACNISNLHICNLIIGSEYNGMMIYIKNCWIMNLIIEKQNNNNTNISSNKTIDINDSYVDNLILNENCCNNFNFSGGGIKEISCPNIDKINPFYGSFNIEKDVFLVNSNLEQYNINEYMQSCRNLRLHIKKLFNINSENILYIHEMRMDRINKSNFIKIISSVYDFTSLYGTSPERSTLCLIFLTIYSSIIIFIHNSAITIGESIAIGWKSELYRIDLVERFYRSIFLSLQSIFNPLYIFSKQTIVEPSNIFFVFFTAFQSICSIILIAMIIFSIRKQFKIAI